MDPEPGAPEPFDDGEARPEPSPSDPAASDWGPEEEGPFFPWLPPEDRLWRHPSEGSKSGPAVEGSEPARPGRRRLGALVGLGGLPRSTWVVAIIAGIIGATAATGVGVAGGLWPHNTTVIHSSAPSTSAVSLSEFGSGDTNWSSADDSVALSVVTISVVGAAGPELGSGLVFMQTSNNMTYVVTDRALFARGLAASVYGHIDVTFATGQTARATLVGTDALSGVAVLRMASPPSGAANPASLGSVISLGNADPVLAVGSREAPSVAPGVVSAQDRTVNLADGSDLDGLLAVSMTPLSPAASGGPLLNQFGQVVGLTLSLDPVDNADQQLTFAEPIDVVSRVATAFINGTAPQHPWLGITDAIDVPSAVAQQMGVYGAVQVGNVPPSGPAEQAGLRSNDIILSLDGKDTDSTGALVADLSNCSPGQTVPITYVRSGKTVKTTVRITSEPTDS